MKFSILLFTMVGLLGAAASCKPDAFRGSAPLPSHTANSAGRGNTSKVSPVPDLGPSEASVGQKAGDKQSNNVASKPQENNANSVDAESDVVIASKPTADELKILCSNANALKPLVLVSEFPQPANSCNWGSAAGNLSQKDGRISARFEESRSLDIPQGALLCRMTISFFGAGGSKTQKMYYDDEIFVLFDELVIASSKDYGPRLSERNGFQVYEWPKLLGTNYSQSGPGPYCIDGAASCVIPKTQVQGVMSLNVSDATVQKLAISSGIDFSSTQTNLDAGQKLHSIGFVTIGDNDDPIDCKHSALGFTVHAEYVIP